MRSSPAGGRGQTRPLGALLAAPRGEKGRTETKGGERKRQKGARCPCVSPPSSGHCSEQDPATLTLSPGCEPAARRPSWEGARGWAPSPQPPHGQLGARSCTHSTPRAAAPPHAQRHGRYLAGRHLPEGQSRTASGSCARRSRRPAARLRQREGSYLQPSARAPLRAALRLRKGAWHCWSHCPSSWCFTGRLMAQKAARISPGPQQCQWDEQS